MPEWTGAGELPPSGPEPAPAPRPGAARCRGRFVVLEGLDGVGKSSHVRRLAERLGAVETREPGGTPSGARIRRLVLDPPDALAARTEALLLAADRAQHVAATIRPALEAGRDVVCDRYLYSSVAYQGAGRGLDETHVRRLSLWATGGLEPDLVLLLVGPRRLGRPSDRLEAEDAAFVDRVAASYRAQAEADPARWAVVDTSGSLAETAERIWSLVRDRLAAP